MLNSFHIKNSKQLTQAVFFILTILLFIVHLTLHSVFVPIGIIAVNHEILYFLWALFYLLIILMGWDFFYITCSDPSDRFIYDQTEAELIQQKKIAYNLKHNLKEEDA